MATSETTQDPKSTAVHELQSQEQRQLLDTIDSLRNKDISANLEIPQVVVCGDQSSGKSSVLEAIAGISFPKGSRTVTRFPTAVILRNSRTASISVGITPAVSSWDEQSKSKIESWQPVFPVGTAEHVPAVINSAKAFLQSLDSSRHFWYDLLRVELSGPDQPHLTLIDLPGLIHQNVDARESSQISILQLTKKYIRNERAVILAVMDAPTDYERHQVIQLLRDSGSIHRTMGVLTMPDRLSKGGDQEADRVRMINDGSSDLGLGWHVLRNLPHEVTDRSTEKRDDEERDFFTKNPWSSLPIECVGAPSLRAKVSQQLLTRVQRYLPKLMNEMENELRKRVDILQRLGSPRVTDDEKRMYLVTISERLLPIIRCALQGEYWNTDVEHFFGDKKERKLRELINYHTDIFASTMRTSGRLYQIGDSSQANASYPYQTSTLSLSFSIDDASVKPQRHTVEFYRYLVNLASHIGKTRGVNLRGTVPPGVYKVIFRQQSRPWKPIIDQCINSCCHALMKFLQEACHHVAGGYGGSQLLNHLILPNFHARVRKLEDKIDELLWPYTEGHPMITDDRFNAFGAGALPSDKESLWVTKVKATASAAEVAAAKAMDTADVYYDIARRTLIENVATLGVEKCLLSGLSDVVSWRNLQALDSTQIANIAGERHSDYALREKSEAQQKTLVEFLQICRTHHQRSPDFDKDTDADERFVRDEITDSPFAKTFTPKPADHTNLRPTSSRTKLFPQARAGSAKKAPAPLGGNGISGSSNIYGDVNPNKPIDWNFNPSYNTSAPNRGPNPFSLSPDANNSQNGSKSTEGSGTTIV